MCRDDLGGQSKHSGIRRMFGHCNPFPGGELPQYTVEPLRFAMVIWQIQEPDGIMTKVQDADHVLDITSEVCPMTFVRTRLALDRMAPGQTLLVRLRGDEPLRNVPRTARELGHEVLSQETGSDGITRLLLRRGG